MAKNTEQPWWEKLPPNITGDSIIANVGAGAQNVAVGKNIQQTVISTLGAPTPNDKQLIEQKFAELNATLAKQNQVPADTKKIAEFQIKLLQGELTKTDPKDTPSASTITQVGDWLLDNVPSMAETVVGLFASPAVGKVVGKAGEVAIKWARTRLGGASAIGTASASAG
ncbi:MAG: hypothetical protein HZB51_12610 [Chloroflexi bacterium]|nr:hypothetical protein [Chloroflexota bacterium]